jgi:CheY-like chemotaxis protein
MVPPTLPPPKQTKMIAFRVLVVDGDADDRGFLCDALESTGVEPILPLEAAEEVFTYLQRVEKDDDLPRLIITDLNMPGISGFELLGALRTMGRYQHIPVVIFSTSNYSVDVAKCIAAGAKQYVTKPHSIKGFQKVSASMKQYVLDEGLTNEHLLMLKTIILKAVKALRETKTESTLYVDVLIRLEARS